MLRRIVVVLLFLPIVAICNVAVAQVNAPPPVAMVRKLSASELNGKTVSRAIWNRPVSVPRFEHYFLDYLPTQQSEVRLAYDDSNLYVAFRCFEENMGKLRINQTKRDSLVRTDDSASVFMDPDNDHKSYYQVMANLAGVQYDDADTRDAPELWNADWSVETAKEANAWTMLFTIPFKSIGMQTPKTGSYIGVNFNRISTPEFERSCWATVKPVTREPGRWGRIYFEDSDTPIISAVPVRDDTEFAPCTPGRAAGTCSEPETPIGAPGTHSITFNISNPTDKPLPLRAEVLLDGKSIGSYKTTTAAGNSQWKLDYKIPVEGLYMINYAIYDARTNKLLVLTSATEVLIPKHKERLAELKKMVDPVSTSTATARDEKAVVLKTIADLNARANTIDGDKAQWKDLGADIKKLEMQINHLRALCADKDGKGYAVGTETALTKVMRDEMFNGKFDEPSKISLAKNEYESAQVVILPYDKSLKGVQVSVSDLSAPDGSKISKDRIQLNPVDFVETRWPRYAADYHGWVPDPLMDNDPFDVPKGTSKPVWITVHTSEYTSAETYKGTVTIKPADAPETSVPIEINVWNFTLPTKMHVKTAFSFDEGELGSWYGKPVTRAQRLQWYDFLLQHHVNPTNIYSHDMIPSMEDYDFCAERGLNSFTLSCTWYKDDKELDEYAEKLNTYKKFLEPRGGWNMGYIYGFDELGPEKYQELRDTYGGIKKRFPELKTMTTVHCNPYLQKDVSIFVPLTSHWDEESAKEYTKAGNDVWWYVCCSPSHPYPNFFTDYSAIDPRILFWMNWKYQIPGVLYYAIDLWDNNMSNSRGDIKDPELRKAAEAGKRWPETPWNPFTCATFNGDGHLIYPGPKGNPLSSIRFESIRDGIEDYEYYYILNSLIDNAKTNYKVDRSVLAKAEQIVKIRSEAVKSPYEYTFDPKVVFSTREEVADMIEQLSK